MHQKVFFLPTGLCPEQVIPSGENEAFVRGQVISINDFDLIRVIGRGSYSKVLMVQLKKTQRLYAMKVIKKELVSNGRLIKLTK